MWFYPKIKGRELVLSYRLLRQVNYFLVLFRCLDIECSHIFSLHHLIRVYMFSGMQETIVMRRWGMLDIEFGTSSILICVGGVGTSQYLIMECILRAVKIQV